ILAVLRQVETRGRLETARRLRAIIGQAFRFAVATGRTMNDPTSALRGALTAPVVQHHAAIVEPVPFGALLRAIDGYDGTPEVRFALQLLALTFTRPGELRFATWKEFDLDASVWTIPANRMKMRRPGRIRLAPQTIAILEELHTLTGQYELLFPGVRSPSRPLSENTLNAALRRLGYTNDDISPAMASGPPPLRFSTNVASGTPMPSKRSSPMSRPTRCAKGLRPRRILGRARRDDGLLGGSAGQTAAGRNCGIALASLSDARAWQRLPHIISGNGLEVALRSPPGAAGT